MSGEAWLYLFAVLVNAVNLFLQVFFTIMYSDLEWYVSSFASLLATFCAVISSQARAYIAHIASGVLRQRRRLLTVAHDAYSDYINPIDLCNRLNTYIIPEAAVHGFLTFIFLINGYWLPLILNLPLLGWNIKK